MKIGVLKMSKELLNHKTKCRLCFRRVSLNRSSVKVDEKIQKKFHSLTSIELRLSETFSSRVCKPCCEQLSSTVSFQQKMIENQQKLYLHENETCLPNVEFVYVKEEQERTSNVLKIENVFSLKVKCDGSGINDSWITDLPGQDESNDITVDKELQSLGPINDDQTVSFNSEKTPTNDKVVTRKELPRSYTEEELNQAIQVVKSGAMTCYKASKIFKVPSLTLACRISASVLKQQEELQLKEFVLRTVKEGKICKTSDLIDEAMKIIKGRENKKERNVRTLTPGWVSRFYGRHPDIADFKKLECDQCDYKTQSDSEMVLHMTIHDHGSTGEATSTSLQDQPEQNCEMKFTDNESDKEDPDDNFSDNRAVEDTILSPQPTNDETASSDPAIHKVVTRKRIPRTYTKEDLDLAIQAVKSGAMTNNKAARTFKIPRETLACRTSGKYLSGHIGRTNILKQQEELQLKEFVLRTVKEGKICKSRDLIDEAMKIIKNRETKKDRNVRTLTSGWVTSFYGRHPEIEAFRKPKKLECDQCEYKTQFESEMVLHMTIHNRVSTGEAASTSLQDQLDQNCEMNFSEIESDEEDFDDNSSDFSRFNLKENEEKLLLMYAENCVKEGNPCENKDIMKAALRILNSRPGMIEKKISYIPTLWHQVFQDRHPEIFKLVQAKTVTCDLCGFETVEKKSLACHMNSHKKFKPEKTTKRYTEEELEHAWKKVNAGEATVYSMAKLYGIPKSTLSQRIRKFKGLCNQQGAFKCSECDKIFSSRNSLRDHLSKFHFPVHGEFLCKTCGKVYSASHKLKAHTKLVHTKGAYSCKVKDCGKVFEYQVKLSSHTTRTHLPSIACEVCGVLVRRGTRYGVHMKSHDTTRQIKCPTEGCDKTYTTTRSLDYHVLNAHGPKLNLKCQQCNSTFPNECRLKIHIKNIHNAQIYFCPVVSCRFKSRELYLVKRHLQNHRDISENMKNGLLKKLTLKLSTKARTAELIPPAEKQKYKQKYNKETLEKALGEIKNGSKTAHAAHKQYNIPKSTLSQYIRGTHVKDRKYQTVLSADNEKLLSNWVINSASTSTPKTKREIMVAAGELASSQPGNPFKNVIPTSGWFKRFSARHSTQVAKSNPQVIGKANAGLKAQPPGKKAKRTKQLLKDDLNESQLQAELFTVESDLEN